MVKTKPQLEHNAPPRVRILVGAATALGPGKVGLLEAIAERGSISGAARDMGMSYRHAWMLVDTMNACFTGDLVTTNTGGRGGGGATVTDLGFEVIRRYHDMEAKAASSVAAETRAFAELLRNSGEEG